MRMLRVSRLSDDLSGVELGTGLLAERRPGQLTVRVRAAALNYPDLLMTRGGYQLKPPLPFVLGMEMAGEVAECDFDSGYRVGDRVVAGTRLGGFADYVLVEESAVRRVPDSFSFAEAAAFGAAYLTAWVALVALGRMQAGE